MADTAVLQVVRSSLVQTCTACPSQWEGRTPDDRPVYIRYRWGSLTVRIGLVGDDIWSAADAAPVMTTDVGDPLDGFLAWREVEAATGIELVEG